MASDSGFLEMHGGYNGTNIAGVYDMVSLGAPVTPGWNGASLIQAHAAGKGRGIRFRSTKDENNFDVTLSLVGMATDGQTNLIGSGPTSYGYIASNDGTDSVTYSWYLTVQVSTDSGKTWANTNVNKKLVFTHKPVKRYLDSASGKWVASDLIYSTYWRESAIDTTVALNNLPDNWTNIRAMVTSNSPINNEWVGFKRSIVIPTYVPMAIRHSGQWRSLDTLPGHIKIRKTNSWKDISKNDISTIGQANKGTARIRKNSQWIQQHKVGT